MSALNLKETCPRAIVDVALKKVKLGIDGIKEIHSAALDSRKLLKENPPDAVQGVSSSTWKEEKDDLHVNAGDCHGCPSSIMDVRPLKL